MGAVPTQGTSKDREARAHTVCPGYTRVNFTPVAFACSKAFLMSSETMRARSQPSVRKTLASPTFDASMRSPITDL